MLLSFLFSPGGVYAATVGELMCTATEPIGNCLYVYGGGWNEEDTAAGTEAMSYGISPRWVEFYNENDASYNYNTTRYQIHDGLDCTGYIGWCMYQMFGNTYSNTGYVFPSKLMAEEYKNLFGAQLTYAGNVEDFKCGDIMSKPGHAYIVLGSCSDGSVVFMHASPPDVSLCGTYTPGGKKNSEAVALAEEYMKKYFSDCYGRYPRCSRNTAYLTDYHQIRLTDDVLSDTDGYRSMEAREILYDMFEAAKLYVNGKRVGAEEGIFIIENSTYVPLRTVCENLGAGVTWQGEEQKAVISRGGTEITVCVGSHTAEVNGVHHSLPGDVFISGDKAYIPVRFIAGQLGAEVRWESKWKRISVLSN